MHYLFAGAVLKLDAYALREAAGFRNTQHILAIFAARFPQIAARSSENWKILIIPYEPPNVIRLATPDGSFSWNTGGWYTDWRISENNIIRYAPDFQHGGPLPLRLLCR